MKHTIYLLVFTLLLTTSCATKNKLSPIIRLTTSEGKIVLKLYPETPEHRDNFVKLVESGYYNNQLFHRIIADFMIQAGDPKSKTGTQNQHLGSDSTNYTIAAEIVFPKYFHKQGALAAARQADSVNPARASSGTQFYIVEGRKFTDSELNTLEKRKNITFTAEQREIYKTIGGAPHLDNEYTVFGQVIKGIEVVHKISKTETGALDRPVHNIIIIKADKIK
ncbi:MAG: peptidylprolyl isomerase [Paludibacter sp.]|jgi:peptidyl-prolyl cis-trans isomerase B (cyclophilin B)|nr:peptidylprolyl isomerase [Paludibacter sp.]